MTSKIWYIARIVEVSFVSSGICVNTLAVFEHSNSKMCSEALYVQKSLKAADTPNICYFSQQLFCCIKSYSPPVL